ncbi:unnamed protein product [Rotaria sordida]|uniref:N-acetyltransferase domain-containing protein n=2 Tax=Rotaria sordida TaxID=392033 RepID=A0A815EKK2_9BILA|nr:unnamed protein product [Rotaria sordida]
MSTSDEYIYEVIDNENYARICAQLLAEEFVASNSMIIFDQLTPQHMFDEDTWPTMAEIFNEQLSFLVRHRQSGEIVATICACDLYLAQEKHPYEPSSAPSLIPYFDLLEEMDDIFIHQDFKQELKPNMVLQIVMGATRAEHSGKGVATRLRTILCEYARNVRGFQYALAQTTNEATRHIYVNKMDGKELTIIDPTTWIWKKKNDKLCPYKDYTGGPIPNILIKL